MFGNVHNCPIFAHTKTPQIKMTTQIIDNRTRQNFETGNWWGFVFFNDETNFGLEFNTKREAVWFINGGYKEFNF